MDPEEFIDAPSNSAPPIKKRINLADYPNIIFKKDHFLNATEKYLVNSCNSYSN